MADTTTVKFSNNMPGIVLSSTNESMQEDLFFPCDSRLYAVNVNGDPACGTLVYDLNSKNDPDKDRGARLQSAFRVIKKPLGQSNSIAFQLGPSGKGDSFGGWFTDIPDGLSAPHQIAIAQASWLAVGCLHVGHLNDKHRLGKDKDGNVINPLHVFMNANFYRSFDEDGPLNVTTYQPPGPDQQIKVPVRFGFNRALQVWDWWTTASTYPWPTPTPTPFPRGPGVTGDPSPSPIPTGVPVPTGTAGGALGGATVGSIAGSSAQSAFNMVATLGALAVPATVARPANYASGQPNTGLFQDPSMTATGPSGSPSSGGVNIDGAGQDYQQQYFNNLKNKADSAPATGVESAYGAQGGVIGAGGGSGGGSTTGGEGDPWAFTQVPSGTSHPTKRTSRFPYGTANGGTCFHPPETDLRDVASNGMAPPGITLSTVYRTFAAGAGIAFGTPELVNGSIKEGVIVTVNGSTGDLNFRAITGSGSPSTIMTLTKSAHTIQWYGAGSFYGELTANNGANRLYTFPDKSGTVALTSDIGTGSSALFQMTTATTNSGSGADTTVVGAGVGSMTIGANKLTVGSTIKVSAWGYYSTTAVPGNLRIKITVGGATFAQTGNNALIGSLTNQRWKIEGFFTVLTTGVGGSAFPQFDFTHLPVNAVFGTAVIWEMLRTAAQGVDTTSTELVDVLTNFDTAGNSITCSNLLMEQWG